MSFVENMKILFASWELDPLYKVGGLADIARSLPNALNHSGARVINVLPYYRKINLKGSKKKVKSFYVVFDKKKVEIEVYQTNHPNTGVLIYLLGNARYFGEIGIDTFALFDLVIVELARQNILDFKPDVIHCNDHHTGLVPYLVKKNKLDIKTVFTIHNLSYQGVTPVETLHKAKISAREKGINVAVSSNKCNFLMVGILFADLITTVSPTYAKEIMKKNDRLAEILRGKEGKVFGILNGIEDDFQVLMDKKMVKYPYTFFGESELVDFSSHKIFPEDASQSGLPQTLHGSPRSFSQPPKLAPFVSRPSGSWGSGTVGVLKSLGSPQNLGDSSLISRAQIKNINKLYNWQEGKRLNKLYLQKKLGLKEDRNMPIFSFIGRFDPNQKGIDILYEMLGDLRNQNYQFVILGLGDKKWEVKFQWLGSLFPKSVSCNLKFDDILAHQIYAGSTFTLIPSKYEPCGLVQMLSMYYGTLPIAHKTGGLADTIEDEKTGFLFENYSSISLYHSVQRALKTWRNKKVYEKMVETAMRTDFSWKKSAEKYLELYKKLVGEEQV